MSRATGCPRSKAPTWPSSLHDIHDIHRSPVCTLYLVAQHRTRGLIPGHAVIHARGIFNGVAVALHRAIKEAAVKSPPG